jgi:antitoxin ParD1/3/4
MSQRTTLNISITPQLRELVAAKVTSGRYQSASEVVREALRLLTEHDARQRDGLAELHKQIRRGLLQARRGDLHDGEPFFASLEGRVRSTRKKA